MKIKNHLVFSGITGSVVYIFTKSPANGIAAFLAGTLIDMDHFIDYYLNRGFSFRIKEIHRTLAQADIPRVYLILHSIELIIIFWLFIFLIPLGSIYLAVAIGITQHIFLDQISNPIMPKAYFLAYRLSNKFRKESIIRHENI